MDHIMTPKPDIKPVSSSTADDTVSTGCTVGPDLNASRSTQDHKLYRQILLDNGLRAVLIQDTSAWQQTRAADRVIDDDSDDSEQEEDTESDDASFASDPGLRDAAVAVVVGTGSAYEDELQGCAHFLEHLLFMGSAKYPGENDYEAYVAQHGGSDNAWTEYESTIYHVSIPQAYLFGALDRLAQFFIAPLFSPGSVKRELDSIESEFQLNQQDDDAKWQQLLCSCHAQHPFGNFSWGNRKSLYDIPTRDGVNALEHVQNFYDEHYYAANMRIVVMGAYDLDELQRNMVDMFSSVPALPRRRNERYPLPVDSNRLVDWTHAYNSPLRNAGSLLNSNSLERLFCIVPVKEVHKLIVTWPLPPLLQQYKSKPADYIAHLMGHEAEHGLLSYWREQGWANACMAGMGDEGHEQASSHGLFSVTVVLSEAGLSHVRGIVASIYSYIGMLRYYEHSEWPEWIFEELQNVAAVAYQYSDEPSPDEVVEDIVEDFAPHVNLPPERLLDGSSLLFEFDGEIVKDLLDNYLVPSKARLDLISSSFGRPSDYNVTLPDDNDTLQNISAPMLDETSDGLFDPATAGDPQIEPWFGTLFWCRQLPAAWVEEWSHLAEPRLPTTLPLALPEPNPFVPTRFDLKPLPDDDAHHGLLHSSLKLCIAVGKTKQWFPATVIQYNRKTNSVLLSYEDEAEQWHVVDQCESDLTSDKLSLAFEGTMDQRTIKFRIVALPLPGQGAVRKFGDDSDWDVELGNRFPPIPPSLPASRLPKEICSSNRLKLWHLQDRHFHRPIVELRLQVVCATANSSPLFKACADLLARLCCDALTETSYLASVCELGSLLESSDVGFGLRFHGFDDKLLDIFQKTMGVLMSFRSQTESLPDAVPPGRFEACLEAQRRKYRNMGMAASDLSPAIRLQVLRPTYWSAHKRLQALENIDVSTFLQTTCSLLDQLAVEALYHGNVDRSDAERAQQVILDILGSSPGLPRKKYPPQSVLRLPKVETNILTAPSKNPDEANTAVQVYVQIAKDNLPDRVLADVLMHIMDEPLYDQLRTKDQMGYDVSCDTRWSYGIIGVYFNVVTDTHSATDVVRRIDRFITEFRQTLVDMEPDDFLEHLAGLATQKLERFDSLSHETDSLFEEIRDGRFQWQVWRDEAIYLRNSITKDAVIKALDDWLLPGQRRRILVVQVIGGSPDSTTAEGRPEVDPEELGDYLDRKVSNFHESCKNQLWGRINSKLF